MIARAEISRDEGEEMKRRYRDALRSGRAPPLARDEAQRQMDIAGVRSRWRENASIQALDQIKKDLISFRDPWGRQNIVEAGYNLFENFGYAGYPAVKQLGEAYIGLMHSRLTDYLQAYERKAITGRRRGGRALDKDIKRALFGERAPPRATALAKLLNQEFEFARQTFNRFAGPGSIPKMENWGGPQGHDDAALLRFGQSKIPAGWDRDYIKGLEKQFPNNPQAFSKEAWVRWTHPKLNWTKMWDPLTGEHYPASMPQEKSFAILHHVWETVATDGKINMPPSRQAVGRGSVATSRSDHRFLIFKDADSAEEYNRECGSGSGFNQTMNHLHGMWRDIALMHRFGPNPNGTVMWLKQAIEEQSNFLKTGHPNMLPTRAKGFIGRAHAPIAHTPRNTAVKTAHALRTIDGFWEQLNGYNAAQNNLALAGTIMRNWTLGSLLGSSVIPHAVANPAIQMYAHYEGGLPVARVIPDFLRALYNRSRPEEMLRAGVDTENALFQIGSLARQQSAFAKVANWTRWLPDRTTHWSQLIPFLDAFKAAHFRGSMAYLSDLRKMSWDKLPSRLKGKLQGYGIREPDWKVMQLAPEYQPVDMSANWMRATDIANMPAETPEQIKAILTAAGRQSLDPTNDQPIARQVAFDTAVKFVTWMVGEREVAVPQSSMRMRAEFLGTAKKGSYWGELARNAFQFKGFVGAFMVTQSQAIKRELGGSKLGGIGLASTMFIVLSLLGMVSLQLKQARSGKDFLPMNPDSTSGIATWARAILTSLSFGFAGDFLAADHTSYGQGPFETLLGPATALPVSAYEMAKGAVENLGGGSRSRKPFSETAADAAIKLLRMQTPFLSTAWPFAAAYNRLVLDKLHYMMNPEAHREDRLGEERLRKQTGGQSFFWRPGESAPSRLPQFTTAPPR
jgi:hypothetical protein